MDEIQLIPELSGRLRPGGHKPDSRHIRYLIYKDSFLDSVYPDTPAYYIYSGNLDSSDRPDGNGIRLLIVEDESLDYVVAEECQGIWEGGVIREGIRECWFDTFWPHLHWIHETVWYRFYLCNILYAEDNPGKRAFSGSVRYEGAFNRCGCMEDPHGCVTIHFHIDYIRKLLREEGSMVLKGEFKDGKLLEGSYKGPFWGFSSLMDKNAVYTGTFKDNVIEGMGVLHYNLGGGYTVQDRMECTYHGHMVSGKKQDDNSSEEIHDTDYGTILTIEGCRYAENMLTGFRKAYVVNENASVVGFEPWLDACRAAEFRKMEDGEREHIIPDDIQDIWGIGALAINVNGRSYLYKNYGLDKLDGNFRYQQGRFILNGTFMVLDETAHSLYLEQWRGGYCVGASARCSGTVNAESKEAHSLFLSFLDSQKEYWQTSALSLPADNGTSWGPSWVLHSLIGLIAFLIKEKAAPGQLNRKKYRQIQRELDYAVNHIKGIHKEIQLFRHHSREWDSPARDTGNFMGGKKGEIYLEYMEQASFHDFIHFMLDEYRECDDIFRSLTRQFLRERDFFENCIHISVDDLERSWEDYHEDYGHFSAFHDLHRNDLMKHRDSLTSELKQVEASFERMLAGISDKLVRMQTFYSCG